jgi:alpha-glucuronidase
VAALYESLETCPDALLLFMHHVPYTHVLHSGRTVIQHIYDSHYRGAEEAEDLVTRWRTLKGRIDEPRYEETLRRLEYQAGHAEVWRDAVCNWFLRVSGIPDERGRAGHFPNRVEAESMDLEGYTVAEITPWEAASGGKYIRCSAPDRRGTARFHYSGAPGWRNVSVRYFDQNNGKSKFKLFVAGQLVDQWVADDHLPSSKPDAHSSTRRVVTGLALRAGDEIRIEAVADGGEAAGIDYVEITKFAEN